MEAINSAAPSAAPTSFDEFRAPLSADERAAFDRLMAGDRPDEPRRRA